MITALGFAAVSALPGKCCFEEAARDDQAYIDGMRISTLGAVLVFGVAVGLSQEVENKDAKPTPAKKAKMLLDSAAEMVAAAKPEVQVAALMHLGDNFEATDKKRALEFYRQAFAATAAVTDAGNQANLQSLVTGMTASLSLPEGMAMLKTMPPHPRRTEALFRVVQRLAQAGDIDQAIALTEMVAAAGKYPLNVLNLLLDKLPAGDYRCGMLFASAVSAFQAQPQVDFGDTIWRHWRKLPPQAVDSALKAMVDWVLERKDAPGEFSASLSSAKGTASFVDQKDYDLFNLVHIIRQFDAKRAEELLLLRPALRAMVDQFPEGRGSMGQNLSSWMSGGKQSADQQVRSRMEAISSSRAEAVRAAMKEDPQKALELVSSIPLPEKQAEVLGQIALSLGELDPEKIRSVLSKGSKLLTDVKEAGPRVEPWLNMAAAAHRIKDDQAAWNYLERAMADVIVLYGRDADEKKGNQAIREQWPSTQGSRRVLEWPGTADGSGPATTGVVCQKSA